MPTISKIKDKTNDIIYDIEDAEAREDISDLKSQIDSMGGGGQPVPITLASEMSDTEVIYLYLGEETGYTYGHIYAHIGEEWTDTGLYGRGQNGSDGSDGFSPTASIASTATGATISITDKNGTTTASITNGTATQEQVDSWLDDHPEATTTVEDGSITKAKLSYTLQRNEDSTEWIRKGFAIRPLIIGKGVIVPIEQGKTYYPYTNSNGTEYMRFLDANGVPIKAVESVYSPFAKPVTSPYTKDETYAYRVDVNTNPTYLNFSVNGTTVSTKNIYANPKENTFELGSAPVYIQLGITSLNSNPSLLWTVGNRYTYGTLSEDTVKVIPSNENLDGFYEEIRKVDVVKDGVVSTEKLDSNLSSIIYKTDNILNGFDAYRKLIGNGEIHPIQQGIKYFQYTDKTETYHYMRFLDANKNPIKLAEGESFVSPFSAPYSPYNSETNYAFRLETNAGNISWYGTCFSVTDDVVTSYKIGDWSIRGSFRLATAPVYIQLGLERNVMWSLGALYDYGSLPSDPVSVKPNENLYDFLEFLDERTVHYVAELVGDSETATQLKFQQINMVNRMRHAFRIASWNIFGAGRSKTNWTDIKNRLPKYGIDLIGFQEVSDPLGRGSNTTKFADVVGGWHLSQFSDAVSYDANARIVAGTSDFVYVGGTDTVYDQQANYGNRYYARTEFMLPTWKGKYLSDHLKISVYDTQLEVGTSESYTNTRLAQARQLVQAMQSDPNPFIILVGDFNEMTTDQSTFEIIREAGFTQVFDGNQTPTCYRGFYDNIFVNDRLTVVNDDVVPITEKGDTISDHNLIMADVIPDYSNIIVIKKTGENCTISGENWLDRRTTEPITITVTADEGYTVSNITVGQGDNDLTYNNGAITKDGNTVTVKPNLVAGDMWISVITTAQS